MGIRIEALAEPTRDGVGSGGIRRENSGLAAETAEVPAFRQAFPKIMALPAPRFR